MSNMQLNYTMQFWEAYPNNRKFFRTHFSDNHEFLGIQVHYMDQYLSRFMQDFYNKGYMKDTMVLFMSDHGLHPFAFHFPMIPDNSRRVEGYMATLFTIMPNDVNPAYLSNMAANEQSFVSSFDIYSTLKNVAVNQNSLAPDAQSYSLLKQKIPSDHD